ncbi:MAG: cytochrome c biogenesis protein CcdA [Acidobacteria bacterium]|nr:cytochrome c biogenesis protein CcdA [Acidobacteriota bacterium]
MDTLAGFSLANAAFAVGAGLASTVSPCVLPVLPIVMAGRPGEHRLRPLAIVAGLMSTFFAMGILSSLFGAVVGPLLVRLEKPVAILIGVIGLLVLADVNPFKRLKVGIAPERKRGLWSGSVLGASLGLVWIPCVGPFLSAVLAMVAARARLGEGMALLGFYSVGFALPMLVAGYAAQAFREKTAFLRSRPVLVRVASGGLLVGLSVWILAKGLYGTPW